MNRKRMDELRSEYVKKVMNGEISDIVLRARIAWYEEALHGSRIDSSWETDVRDTIKIFKEVLELVEGENDDRCGENAAATCVGEVAGG